MLPLDVVERRSSNFLRPFLRSADGAMKFGGLIVGSIILIAILAPVIAPHDPYDQELSARLLPPAWHAKGTWAHPLGTDQLGRDYMSRLIYGSRISILIGISIVAISATIGTTLGGLAGYFKGRVDLFITFLITVRLSMPASLVALAVVSLVGNSLRSVILVLGFLLWDRFAVVTRTVVMHASTLEYVAAAQCLGCSTVRILVREILPNIASSLVVVATLEIAHAVLLEASLSFLGLGVQPPTPSWGLMMAEGKDQIFFSSWLIVFPGAALFLLMVGVNVLGDSLRQFAGSKGG